MSHKMAKLVPINGYAMKKKSKINLYAVKNNFGEEMTA
jgi:hypothetical protein